MKISFNINYRTKWGESLYICGSLPELGAGDDSKAPRLDYLGGETWHLTIDVNDLAEEFD